MAPPVDVFRKAENGDCFAEIIPPILLVPVSGGGGVLIGAAGALIAL